MCPPSPTRRRSATTWATWANCPSSAATFNLINAGTGAVVFSGTPARSAGHRLPDQPPALPTGLHRRLLQLPDPRRIPDPSPGHGRLAALPDQRRHRDGLDPHLCARHVRAALGLHGRPALHPLHPCGRPHRAGAGARHHLHVQLHLDDDRRLRDARPTPPTRRRPRPSSPATPTRSIPTCAPVRSTPPAATSTPATTASTPSTARS